MGVKKGEKRPWDTHKNKKEEDKINITVSLRMKQEEVTKLKNIRKQYNISSREIFLIGLNSFSNEQ